MGDGYEGAAVPRLPSRVLPWEFCHWWCSPQKVRVVGTEGQQIGLGEGWLTREQVHAIGDELSMTLYGQYLQCL